MRVVELPRAMMSGHRRWMVCPNSGDELTQVKGLPFFSAPDFGASVDYEMSCERCELPDCEHVEAVRFTLAMTKRGTERRQAYDAQR